MTGEPRIDQRVEQPYVAIAARVSGEAELRGAVDRGFPALFRWLGDKNVEPSGAPFIRYLEIDAAGAPVEMEIGAPVAAARDGEGEIRAGVLPAGRYATVRHIGPYNSADSPDLSSAREALLAWARREDIGLESSDTGEGTRYRASVEHYLNDASQEPDPSKWETELAYLIAD